MGLHGHDGKKKTTKAPEEAAVIQGQRGAADIFVEKLLAQGNQE